MLHATETDLHLFLNRNIYLEIPHECIDEKDFCKVWAGNCKTHEFVAKSCRLTCGLCSTLSLLYLLFLAFFVFFIPWLPIILGGDIYLISTNFFFVSLIRRLFDYPKLQWLIQLCHFDSLVAQFDILNLSNLLWYKII